MQVIDCRAELVCPATPISPGVIDGIRCKVGSWVIVGQVPWRQVPLKAGQESIIIPAAAIGHVFTMNGLGTRCHTDLVTSAIITHHRPGGVGSVPKAIPRVSGICASGIPPVIVVIVGGAGWWIDAATIAGFNCGMCFIQPGIIASYDRPLAGNA